MNSREIILNSINHKEPERVPVDMGSTPSSGISAMAYNKLKRRLGFDHPTRIYDVVQQLAQPHDEVILKLGIDCLDIGRTFNAKNSDWYDMTLADDSNGQYPVWFKPVQNDDGSFVAIDADGTEIARMPRKGAFFDQSCFPYIDGYPDDWGGLDKAMNKVLWANLVHSPWDHAGEADFWDKLRENTLKIRDKTDKALVVVCGCNLFEWGTFLRRMDNFLMDIYAEPVKVEALLDELMKRHLQTLEKVCNAVGDIVDILRFGDDLGSERGPFMSPEIYRRIFKPRHTILCDYVKKNSQMHTFLHSCGSIYKLIPDLIEAGFEILNPVQTVCTDMDAANLKREFGNNVTFWGAGCDTRKVLNMSTPDEVKRHVLENLELLMPGGGFVFNTVHNILPEVPVENILAIFDAIGEFNGKKTKQTKRMIHE